MESILFVHFMLAQKDEFFCAGGETFGKQITSIIFQKHLKKTTLNL